MKSKTTPRVEGADKVTGRARYSADVRLPGLLYARVLRSAMPHASIRRVDTASAERLAGVRAVLCRDNAPRIPWYETSCLFDETVRFVGDELAAVAADSEDIAADALRLIAVQYEPLPFAADLDACVAAAPKVRGRGDVEAGERDADVSVDEIYTTQAVVHNALESHGCTASWEDGVLTLYESTQGIFSVRDEVAEKLGLPKERVRVITEHMGGGFGAKQIAWKHSVIAALLAERARRPVQLMLDREAENIAVGYRQPTRQRVRLGARRDGTLTFIDADVTVDRGIYATAGEASMVTGIWQTLYRCPNVRVRERQVRTNLGPAVAFRAPGYAETAFGLESAMDELARKLAMDPVALRLLNRTEVDQRKGRPYSSPRALENCCRQAAAAFGWQDYKRPPATAGKRRGIGFAAHNWGGGAGYPPAQARVLRRENGSAHVVVGTQDIGTGTRTALVKIAAETLGLPDERVTIALGDTAPGLYAPVSSGSATLATLGPAVRDAALRARSSPEGYGERGPNPKDVTVQTCGAQCAEVEVDVETGEVTVLRVVAAHDCGRIVHEGLVESQVIGGVTQGVGYACTEARVVDAELGLVLNADLEEYKVPTVGDVPEIIDATASMPDERANPLGAKGVGEPPVIPTAPAIANAVFDATGIRIRDLPLLRERLLSPASAGPAPGARTRA
jgi:CO/xanthine dehydrogenase Mo-binding subunit